MTERENAQGSGGRGDGHRDGRSSDEGPAAERSAPAPSAPPGADPVFNLEGRTLKESTPGLSCELCGGPVLDRHCKVVCLNCGFIRDCSDP